MTASETPIQRSPERSLGERAFDFLIWGGLAALLVAGFRGAEIARIGDLFAGTQNMRQFGVQFIRPNFRRPAAVANTWLTIQTAL